MLWNKQKKLTKTDQDRVLAINRLQNTPEWKQIEALLDEIEAQDNMALRDQEAPLETLRFTQGAAYRTAQFKALMATAKVKAEQIKGELSGR